MGRPLSFVRLDIARFGVEISDKRTDKELADWIRSLHRALVLENPDLNEYAGELLQESHEFREKSGKGPRDYWDKVRKGTYKVRTRSVKVPNTRAEQNRADQIKTEKELHPFFEDSKFKEAWTNWEKSRKESAGKFQLRGLLKLSAGNLETAVLILEQSTYAGWKGLFALKGQTNGTHYKSKSERLGDAARDLKRRIREAQEPDRTVVFTDVTVGAT